ncbi:hypothetical protein AB0K80_26400 [Streptomyces sp. NPDC052682]|uniref:hypothetical protein n=1 Tax=Streptomyces sp. NPDC052682 TaxID=3154954 RepID=UPI00343BF628
MAGQQFLVPDDAEVLEAFGVESEATDGVESTRSLRLAAGVDDEVCLTYDIPARSIHLQWFRKGVCVLDVSREEAVRLSVNSSEGVTALALAFESASLSGELRIQVWPTVSISDRLLAH